MKDRQTFAIEYTRKEFIKLPLTIRRRALTRMTDVMLRLEAYEARDKQWCEKWKQAVETASNWCHKHTLAAKALDALALALTKHGHKWTASERKLYERGMADDVNTDEDESLAYPEQG